MLIKILIQGSDYKSVCYCPQVTFVKVMCLLQSVSYSVCGGLLIWIQGGLHQEGLCQGVCVQGEGLHPRCLGQTPSDTMGCGQ